MTARAAAIRWLTGREPESRTVRPVADAEVIAEFLHSGSQEHFGILVQRYKDRVFRLLASILGPGFEAEAEDLTQEVFVRVYHKLTSFRQESRFETWLYRLTYRVGIDAKRRARHRYPHVSDEALAERQVTGRSADPLSGALDRETRGELHAALEDLGEPARTAVRLYYWMDCSIAEISTYLDMKPGTVKSQLFRARERLARQLRATRGEPSRDL